MKPWKTCPRCGYSSTPDATNCRGCSRPFPMTQEEEMKRRKAIREAKSLVNLYAQQGKLEGTDTVRLWWYVTGRNYLFVPPPVPANRWGPLDWARYVSRFTGEEPEPIPVEFLAP